MCIQCVLQKPHKGTGNNAKPFQAWKGFQSNGGQWAQGIGDVQKWKEQLDRQHLNWLDGEQLTVGVMVWVGMNTSAL